MPPPHDPNDLTASLIWQFMYTGTLMRSGILKSIASKTSKDEVKDSMTSFLGFDDTLSILLVGHPSQGIWKKLSSSLSEIVNEYLRAD